MRRFIPVVAVSMLFTSFAYAGEVKPGSYYQLAERPASDVKVVMYMTTW